MHILFEFAQKFPVIVILLILAGCVVSAFFLPNLWIDSTARSMMMAQDPDLGYYDETIQKFGSDTLFIVYVKDKDLFTAYKLTVLEKLVNKLSDNTLVPGVQRVESLFSVNNIKGYAGIIDTTPLMDYPPETDDDARVIMEKALDNPVLFRNLISEDGTTTVVNLYLKPAILNPRGSDSTTVKGIAHVIKSRIDEDNPGAKTFMQEFDKVFEIGGPYIRETLTTVILQDMKILVPLACAVLMVMLIITMGSFNGAILPFITASLSILFTFGFMGAFRLPFNILTFIIPVLVIVIGSTEDVHILSGYREGLHQEGTKKLAINFMSRAIGTSVFLTSLTTFLGFLSIAMSRVTVLIQFGLIAGFALFINSLVTFLVSPVYLRFFGAKKIKKKEKKGGIITQLLMKTGDKLLILIKQYKVIIFIVFIGSAVVIGIFSIFINVDNDTIKYFKKDSELIQRMQIMHHNLSGARTFFIRISRPTVQDGTIVPDITDEKTDFDSASVDEIDILIDNGPDAKEENYEPGDDIIIIDEEDTFAETGEEQITPWEKNRLFQDPKYMRLIDDIQQHFEAEYPFDKTVSIANFIRILHKEMNSDEPGDFDKTPEPADSSSANLIAQYAQLLHHDDISSYITTDWNEANIIVRHNITSSEEVGKVLQRLNRDLETLLYECDPYLTFKATGENVLYNKAADSIATSQISSLGLLLVTIFIIMSILFTNIKAGLLSLVPNLLPIAILFGIMGIFQIPLNIGTCMVAAVAIGISVDDTIHFMTRFNKEMRELQEKDRVIKKVIHAELRPILSTSIALTLGFIILSQSSLIPIIFFGILTSVVMICALLADLLITPVLLTSFQLINLSDIFLLKLANECKCSPLFRGMSMFQIKKFTLMGKVVHRQTGEYIIKAGDVDQKMYILLKGKVNVQRRDRESKKVLFVTTLGCGDVFGEISLLRKAPRSADIVAEEPISYLEIDWKGLKRIRKSSKSISLKLYLNLARILSKRLVQTTDMLEKLEL